jgi:hypothetical protein
MFIVTTSLWAAEGLLPANVLQVWAHFRTAYLVYTEGQLTPGRRELAKNELRLYGHGLQTVFGITACTITNHLIIVEADGQIPVTGPIKESMGSWVERMMFMLLEQVRRRYPSF